ncbi:MAG: pilus assembly protein [Bdellovibrionaceae bacterium]|nr:pilus assembly protein [Bdellovibrio sp.]
MKLKLYSLIFAIIFTFSYSFKLFAQDAKTSEKAAEPDDEEISTEKPNGKRIRRHVNLIAGVEKDEELLIPDRPTILKGRTDFFDIKRIKGTDFFRITPKKVGNGIATINDKKTGQILVELRFDIRDDTIEKSMREIQSLLGDIEGIEFKIVNSKILIDGYAILPRDLIRISQVVANYGRDKVTTLVTLSPIARKKIAEYISRDVNNPEVSITAVGDYLKLEGQVNNKEEKDRITSIVELYMPDVVVDIAPETEHIKIMGRKSAGTISSMVINLITIKKDEDKVEPPPKMIQVVAHFVEFSDGYSKGFDFNFTPSLSAIGSTANRGPTSTLGETAQILNNLLPKLRWAKYHGFAKVLDTASILIQDGISGNIERKVDLAIGYRDGENGSKVAISQKAGVSLSLIPRIKSERSGLIQLEQLSVQVNDANENSSNETKIKTQISVRDRQSAAFGGLIKKQNSNSFGGPQDNKDAIITLRQGRNYARKNSQFVVFITPIIKSSASAGVDQVKKKFRLRE